MCPRRVSMWLGLGAFVLGASACGSAAPQAAAPDESGAGQVVPVIGQLSQPAASPRATAHSPSALASRSPAGRAAKPSNPARPPLPLSGKVVGIDPGHNGGNFNDASFINTLIWNGRESETCDTTGTETDSGYTEAQFNFNVASYLRADLIAEGAKVVMTRTSNSGVGPCVTTRAQIINRAHANVAIDIHADGGPATGRGFTVLEPVADGPNNKIIASSLQFGGDVRSALLHYTGMPESDYAGTSGVEVRDDLAGLNLTTVPKILIECGNMRNATDAALLVQPAFQRLVARAFAAAIVTFLSPR